MNSLLDRYSNSKSWQTIVMFVLGFWLSGSLVLDAVILPSLYGTGMMSKGDFATMGYVVFGIFNRVELFCAALAIVGVLVLRYYHHLSDRQDRLSLVLSGVLFAIALIYTYILTPQMSGLGMQLDLFTPTPNTMPPTMMAMQMGYWGLEVVKLFAGATLLRWLYSNAVASNR
ncbi:MAG: DUF4149 domain-containing protein [Cyanobacteria bacterium SBLK]|nr:DUF4149 domain-containing protein [Cyanobacteria bacterium SBLK]